MGSKCACYVMGGHLEPERPMNVWIRGIFSWLRDAVSFNAFPHVNVTPVASQIRGSCV